MKRVKNQNIPFEAIIPSDRNGVELTWLFDDVLKDVWLFVVAVILVCVCTIVDGFVGSGLASSSHQMHFFKWEEYNG